MPLADHSFQHFLFGLIAVANSVPAIPLYLVLCENLHPREQHKLCFIATATSLITMVASVLFGMSILNFFEISISSFRIAGGLLLLNTGLSMMKSSQDIISLGGDTTFSKMISLAVIPIAIPLTTGAGTISTVILFSQQFHRAGKPAFELFGAIFCMSILIYLSFRYSTLIIRFLGQTGMEVLSKLFGLFTLAIGIQFIIGGISGAFPKIM